MDTCVICLDEIKDYYITECKHKYCKVCIASYIIKKHNRLVKRIVCPTCRKKINVSNIFYRIDLNLLVRIQLEINIFNFKNHYFEEYEVMYEEIIKNYQKELEKLNSFYSILDIVSCQIDKEADRKIKMLDNTLKKLS